jgi:hypothetical protein
MEHTNYGDRHAQILTALSGLPRKMVAFQGADQVAAFVLYELCQKNCFDLERAAYFVDNPDFNCLKGVAGCAQEELHGYENIWASSDNFLQLLAQSPFHAKVAGISHGSIKHGSRSEHDAIRELATHLGIKNPTHCCWNMKHDNHGLLIFETTPTHDAHARELLVNGLNLLSFCPII